MVEEVYIAGYSFVLSLLPFLCLRSKAKLSMLMSSSLMLFPTLSTTVSSSSSTNLLSGLLGALSTLLLILWYVLFLFWSFYMFGTNLLFPAHLSGSVSVGSRCFGQKWLSLPFGQCSPCLRTLSSWAWSNLYFPICLQTDLGFFSPTWEATCVCLFLVCHCLCLLSFRLAPLSILLWTGLLLKPPLLRYAPFSSFLRSIGYLSPAFPYPGSPFPCRCYRWLHRWWTWGRGNYARFREQRPLVPSFL